MKTAIIAILLMSPFMATAQIADPDDPMSEDPGTPMSMTFTADRPFFRALGGVSNWSLTNASDIEASTTFGVILGFEGTKTVRSSSIAHTNANGLYVTYHTAGTATSSTYALEAWRFGFNTQESYGYKFSDDGNAGLYLGSTKAPLSWYSVSVDGVPTEPTGLAAINRFPDALRFGEAATANVDVRVADAISVNVGYEWAQVYERHLFWYWGLSSLIEGVADGAAGWFVKSIGKNSPAALPIMHFIIRNGIAMGF